MYTECNDYIVKNIKNGPMQNNSLLIIKNGECVVIDPASKAIIDEVESNSLVPVAVLLTHGHFDHVKGVQPFLDKGVPVYLHEADNPKCNGTFWPEYLKRFRIMPFNATDFLEDGEVLEFMGLDFKVITTPGHSSGSVCYVLDDILFAGDTVFEQSYGRYDFEDSSFAQLKHSIKVKIFGLHGNYRIIPGHGPETDLDYERVHNAILLA